MLLCRPWREVGELGVGGGGSGVSLVSMGVEGSERVSESEIEEEASSSQLSAM